MKRTSVCIALILLGTLSTSAHAGWHHRHHYYQAYQTPLYVAGVPATPSETPLNLSQAQINDLASQIITAQLAAQAQAQQQQPQAQALPTPPAPLSQAVESELRRRAGDLLIRLIDETRGGGGGSGGAGGGGGGGSTNLGSDEVASELRRLRESLNGSTNQLKEISELHTKHILEIREQLTALNKAVHGKTPPAVKKAIESDGFKATLKGLLKDESKVEDAVKILKEKLESTLE